REFTKLVEKQAIATEDVMSLLQILIPQSLKEEVPNTLGIDAALDKLVDIAYSNSDHYVDETKWLSAKQTDYVLFKHYLAKINENLNIYVHLTGTPKGRQETIRRNVFYAGLGEE